MMRVVAKISIYDILAMIVPGSIFLMGIGMFDGICDKVQEMPFIEYFGVNGHAFWTATGTIFFLALSYAIGIMIQTVNVWMNRFFYSSRNKEYVVNYIKKRLDGSKPYSYALTKSAREIIDKNKKKDSAISAYYEAYNYAIIYNPRTAVQDMEKQIAMMRNLIFALLPGCVALMWPKCFCGVMLWVEIVLVLVFFITQRMRKVIELVFEEYETVKKFELDKKQHKNIIQ